MCDLSPTDCILHENKRKMFIEHMKDSTNAHGHKLHRSFETSIKKDGTKVAIIAFDYENHAQIQKHTHSTVLKECKNESKEALKTS